MFILYLNKCVNLCMCKMKGRKKKLAIESLKRKINTMEKLSFQGMVPLTLRLYEFLGRQQENLQNSFPNRKPVITIHMDACLDGNNRHGNTSYSGHHSHDYECQILSTSLSKTFVLWHLLGKNSKIQ